MRQFALTFSFLLVLFAVSAFSQQSPILVNDDLAQGRTGVWTNLSNADQIALHGEAAAAALNATSAVTINSVVHWSGSFKYAPTGHVYPYTMIGTNPFSNPVSSTVPVAIIPLKFVFDGYLVNGKPLVFDPTSKLTLLKASPLFASHNYGFGAAQYTDALQRNTFNRTNGYHVRLGTPRMLPTHTVHVPAKSGTVFKTSQGYVGDVEVNFLLNIIAHLPHTLGVKPSELAVMASSNVYGGSFPSDGFYDYGFHGNTGISSTSNSTTVQVWAWSSWIGPGFFSAKTLDITGFSHEVAEATNDPFLNNLAPTYGYPYDTSSCSNIIEVADIAEGFSALSSPVSVNGYTYHVANVAMLPWFSRTTATTTTRSYSFPSTSLLTTHAANCK